MDPNDGKTTDELAYEFLPYFRAYKDGRVERFFGTDVVPASADSESGVSSKDVVISPENGVSARLFYPTAVSPGRKLPLLIYFHGGAFCFGSPFCAVYHNYITSFVSEADIVALSVDYRLAPENPLPIAYEDAWATLNWVGSHFNGQGQEDLITNHVDLRRVFVAGESAGGNITHNVTLRAGIEDLAGGMKLAGACLVQPDFASKEGSVYASWKFACPTTTGSDDRRINPAADPRLRLLGCSRVAVFLAERDSMRERGLFYYETLRESGWGGAAEVVESEGEGHVFHLFNPGCEKATEMLKKMASFMNELN